MDVPQERTKLPQFKRVSDGLLTLAKPQFLRQTVSDLRFEQAEPYFPDLG
jgi:hypothetical protein